MFKYVRFTPVESQFTTLTFKKINEDVKVNFFTLPVVSIEADNEALIDELISSQVKEIKCEVITKEEFINLIKLTSQYKRIIERGNEKLEKLTLDIAAKYPLRERETWYIQLEEAKKYIQTQNEADAPFLKILAENEGDTIEAFANAVINNDIAFRTLTANALSEKRILEQNLLAEIGA